MKKRRLLSLLLTICMVMSLVPTVAYAEEGDPPVQIEVKNSHSGNTQYKVGNGEWTDLNTSQVWDINNVSNGDTVTVRAIPNSGQELDGAEFWVNGMMEFIDNTALQTDAGWSFTYTEGSVYQVCVEYRNGGDPDPDNPPPASSGELRFTCQGQMITGGSIYYKLNGAEEFTKVSEENNQYNSIMLTDTYQTLTIKLVPNSGFKLDLPRGVTLRVNGNDEFNSTDTNISDFTSESGYTFNLSDLVGNGSVSQSSFEIEFGFENAGDDNPGGDPEDSPTVGQGDVKFEIGNIADAGTLSYSTDNIAWQNVANNTVISKDQLTNVQTIYVKAIPNSGYKLDDYVEDGISANQVRTNGTAASLTFTENVASFSYVSTNTYEVIVRFMSDDNTPMDQEGNLAQDVTLNIYEYKIDHENGGYQALSRPDNPTGFMIESFKLNGFECFLQQDATVTFVNGGYAVDGDQKNTLSFRESFGGKAEAIYLINVAEDGTVTKIEGSDFIWNSEADNNIGRWELENIAPAESYNVAVVEGVSDDLTVIWTTDYNTAATWNPDGTFATDMYVEHGQVAVTSIERNGEILYDGHQVKDGATGVGVSISEKFGYVTLTCGDTVTLKLIPDYGYQLKSIGAVTTEAMTATSEVSTFTISNIQNNIHFSSIFEKASNQVVIDSDTSITNATVDATGIESGIVAMDVTSAETRDVSATTQGTAIATVDIALTNRISKGTENEYWDSEITEIPDGTAMVSLTVDGLEDGATYVVVREHEGEELTVLTATNESGTLTFESNKFSTYTIVKTTDVPAPPSVPTDPSDSFGSSTPSNSTITTTNPDGSTTTTVTDKITGSVTETTTYKPVTDEAGNITQTTTETVTNKDGSTVETVTETVKATDGSITAKVTETNAAGETTVTVAAAVSAQAVTAAAASGTPVTLPVEVAATKSAGTAPVVNVEVLASVSAEAPAKVEIPVENTTPGTVAVLVHADGTEEIIKTSVLGKNGVVLTLDGTATVKIVDNSKTFDDVQTTDWHSDAVDFVTARGIFNGNGDGTFTPKVSMTRGMLSQVLYNLENNPDVALTCSFEDVSDGAWYAEAVCWAADQGIVNGYGGGIFGAEDSITREQLATMLWRYAGSPDTTGSVSAFSDADLISAYADTAMRWAVENGVLQGNGNGTLNPTGRATRAETAQMLMNFLSKQK